MIRFLLEKEFKQMLRNTFFPKLIVIFPCMIMFLMPWAVSLEIKNVQLGIVDNDHSTLSRRLVDRILTSTYFKLVSLPATYEAGLRQLETGALDIVMELPPQLERDWLRGEPAEILISANAVDGMKGGLGSSYLANIINNYADELRKERPTTSVVHRLIPQIRIDSLPLYNPNLNYKLYMIPAFMAMLLTLMCGFLPAANIVAEKEIGTIEQMNVSPVPKFLFVFSKVLPYWIVGYVVLTISFILAWLIYGVVPAGSFVTIYVSATLFVLTISGFGLLISNYSSTVQQAMFLMLFFLIIILLISGLFTPVSSMPDWAQFVARCNPITYFMTCMRMVYLKGCSLIELLPQLCALTGFAIFFNVWAVLSYRKLQH